MLKHLYIKNVAVIEEINIEFFHGFSVLTGETGAGKSIIIDSINLLKGERASRSIIRSGEDKARVVGEFEVESDAAAKIAELIGTDEESEIIISRELSADGKNTIRVNGMPANIAMLKQIGEFLINIHGQHDNTSLLSVKSHINFLDGFGKEKIQPVYEKYKEDFSYCKQINEQLQSLATDEQEKLRRKDMLEYQIKEIEEAALEVGEDEQLISRKLILDNSAKISENTKKAYECLYDSENATAHDMLWDAISYLEKVSGYDGEISEIYDSLSDIAENLNDKIRDLRHISENVAYDEEEANYIENRLELISNLKRKYGASIEEILKFYENAADELEKIESSDINLERLNSELEKAKKALSEDAAELTDLRKKYGKHLAESIGKELKELNMEKVEFTVMINPSSSYRPNGCDEVEFMVRTNVGEDIKPLTKIASGGELSRIMLAIKSVMADTMTVGTSIYDEIDTGVSGAAAQKIGEKLLKMAKKTVVLCITHLPQIAALADNHYLIEKETSGGRTRTGVKHLSFEERVEEIARTLGGNEITDITRENARQLLDQRK